MGLQKEIDAARVGGQNRAAVGGEVALLRFGDARHAPAMRVLIGFERRLSHHFGEFAARPAAAEHPSATCDPARSRSLEGKSRPARTLR